MKEHYSFVHNVLSAEPEGKNCPETVSVVDVEAWVEL